MALPAAVLDLTNWKLTLPIGSKNKPTEVKQPTLGSFTDSRYFRTGPDGGVVFRAPVNGVTTSGSANPRAELREMNTDGSNASWSSTDGKTHTMVIDQAVTRLPNPRTDGGNAAVVCGQIHDSANDLCVFRVEAGKVWVTKGNDTHFAVADSAYALGTRFTAMFVIADGAVSGYYNGKLVVSFPLKGSGWYFKAGCYTQANATNSQPADASNYGEVVLHAVTVAHVAAVPMPGPVPAPTPAPTPPPVPSPPAVVMVIRHGEKPADKNDHTLNATGRLRAEKITELFTGVDLVNGLFRPTRIYASKGTTASMRPLQTVQPLAAALGLSINTSFDAENAMTAMGGELAALPGVTLVSLEHTAIVGVCRALGTATPKVPSVWPADRFDVVWVFVKQPGGWRFWEVPEQLLPGDKATGIGSAKPTAPPAIGSAPPAEPVVPVQPPPPEPVVTTRPPADPPIVAEPPVDQPPPPPPPPPPPAPVSPPDWWTRFRTWFAGLFG